MSLAIADEILLLDDDPQMLVFLEGILSSAGYICHTHTDPAAALVAISAQPAVGLVLSDVCMPDITGLQFIDRLNSLSLEWPAPRVVLLTGSPSLERAIDALRLGAQDFLIKPIRAPDLINAVDRALNQAKADHETAVARPPELQHLMQQADELAQRLRTLAFKSDANRVASNQPTARAARKMRGALGESEDPKLHVDAARPCVEPLGVLDTIEQLRRLRERYTAHHLDEIEWDLLLELLRAERLNQRMSVSALTIAASGASATTSLRRVNQLVSRGYIERCPDATDARRDFVTLTSKSNELLADYLARANEHLQFILA